MFASNFHRTSEKRIFQRLKPNKVILLFGARRVGKTILLKNVVEQFNGKTLILNGEDFDTQTLLEPASISNYKRLLQGVDLLVIDEAQNISDIGKKLKLMVDEIAGIRIIASGSSSFDLLNKAGEPLVGRSSQFYLYPFSQTELAQRENALETRQNLDERLIYGSYPEVVLMNSVEQKKEYLREIVNSYLLKDILAIEGLKNANKMADLLRLIAFQTGNLVSYDELAKQLGISRNTVEKYLDLLSKVFVIYRLGSYSGNLRKELSKAGKWYFFDNGIRNALIRNYQALNMRQDTGQLWESYLISERMKQNEYSGLNKTFYFWRTYDGQEIDLLEDNEGKLQAFEFKWSDRKIKKPKAFADAYPKADFEIISRENYLDFIT